MYTLVQIKIQSFSVNDLSKYPPSQYQYMDDMSSTRVLLKNAPAVIFVTIDVVDADK